MTGRRQDLYIALGFAFLFILVSIPFIERAGLYEDESIFALATFPPHLMAEYSPKIFGVEIPTMLVSYTGTVKSLLYKLIFGIFDPSPWSIRFPLILLGAGTVAMFFYIVKEIAGTFAGVLGTMLLATDALFVLTTMFDWGPVTFQHLLIVGGARCLVRFVTRESHWALFGGFLLLGLALWDKALAVWMLSGMGIAAISVYPKQLWGFVTPKSAAIAVGAFVVGAYPLIDYNVKEHGKTFTQNTHWTTEFQPKLIGFERTFSGQGLFGWLTAGGEPLGGWMLWLFAASLLLLPLCFHTRAFRPAIFAFITFTVAWAQMFFNEATGSSAHHVILLWPLPQLVVALVLATIAIRFGKIARWSVVAVVIFVSIWNLAVLNRYRTNFDRFGAGLRWSKAVFTLSDSPAIKDAKRIGVTDWGFGYSLYLLKRGGDKLLFIDSAAATNLEAVQWVTEDGVVLVRHTPGNEVFKDIADPLDEMVRNRGFVHETLQKISDERGQEIFEIYRYRAL